MTAGDMAAPAHASPLRRQMGETTMPEPETIQRAVCLGVAREISPYRGTPAENTALFAAAATVVSALEVALGPRRAYEIIQCAADDLALQIIASNREGGRHG